MASPTPLPRLTATPLGARAEVAWLRRTADHTAAEQQARAVLDEASRSGDFPSQALALLTVAWCGNRLSHYTEAHRDGQAALSLYLQLGDEVGRRLAMNVVGQTKYLLGDYHGAIDLFTQAHAIAHRQGDLRGEADLLNGIGATLHRLGEYAGALERLLPAAELYRQLGDPAGEAKALNNIGNVHYRLGDFTRALQAQTRNLELQRQCQSDMGEAAALNNIGIVHDALGDYTAALEAFQQSLMLARRCGDRQGESNSLHNVGLALSNLNRVDDSLQHYEQSLALARAIGDRQGEGRVLKSLGKAWARLGLIEKALACQRQSLAVAEQVGDPLSQLEALLAAAQLERDEAAATEASLRRALGLAEQLGSKPALYSVHEALAQSFQRRGNFERALHHFQRFHALKEEVFADEAAHKARQLHSVYQVERARQEADYQRQRASTLAELNARISAQNDWLAAAQSRMEESLGYARALQQALLPDEASLARAFPQHALFFRSKEQVSGDFYWIHHGPDFSLVAVADCTGHGVPGALISMIGIVLLQEIVAVHGENAPGRILARFDPALRAALHADVSRHAGDGMEVALLRLDATTVRFAGAGRPLAWVEANGIAGQHPRTGPGLGWASAERAPQWAEVARPRIAGDTYFLATDGWADQNNAAGQRLGQLRTRQHWQAIAALPASQRSAALAEAFDGHRGDEPQRDDVAVLVLTV